MTLGRFLCIRMPTQFTKNYVQQDGQKEKENENWNAKGILVDYSLILSYKFFLIFSDEIAENYKRLDEESMDQNDKNETLDDGKDKGLFMYVIIIGFLSKN